MKVHEYQAKALMREYGIVVPSGELALTVEEAGNVASKLGGDKWAVKAQIHAGGRGKGGGVVIANSLKDVTAAAKKILGMNLVTHQTGPQGKIVNRLLVESCCQITHEYYVGVVLDRSTSRITFIASSEGGMDIEQVAQNTPEKIVKAAIDPSIGYTSFIGRKLAYNIGLSGDAVKSACQIFESLYKLYIEKDCSIVEINPLVLTNDAKLVALDGKINFDDNALFRHPEISQLRDPSEESPEEIEASKFGLNYIKLDGNIGCLVNGAGLAMATMDIIKIYGGTPANFLDVGGGASKEAVQKAFTIILQDKNVEGILVNLFGGIMKCDVVAQGVVDAANELSLKVPLVVRLEGTNVQLGKQILAGSGLDIITAVDFSDAAQKVVAAVAKGKK